MYGGVLGGIPGTVAAAAKIYLKADSSEQLQQNSFRTPAANSPDSKTMPLLRRNLSSGRIGKK